MPVITARIVTDLAKMASEACGIFDHMCSRASGLNAACNRARLRDWLRQSREHYATSWKTVAPTPPRPVLVSLDDLRELAEMAASAWQDIQDLPEGEQGDFADALLENSLDLHRKYFTDGWKAEKARLAGQNRCWQSACRKRRHVQRPERQPRSRPDVGSGSAAATV